MLELNTNKRISASECLKSAFIYCINTQEKVPDLLPNVLSNIYKLNAREKIQQATITLIVQIKKYRESMNKRNEERKMQELIKN